MPNHITNYVRIRGEKEKLDKLVKATKLKRDKEVSENEFDFNGIIKMPKELENTQSPSQPTPDEEMAEALDEYQARLTEWRKKGSKAYIKPRRGSTLTA